MKKTIFTLLFLVVFLMISNAQVTPTSGVVYVRQGGTGNGSSWALATGDLHSAIMAAGVTEVWVAAGTYYPTWQWDIGDARAYSFRLRNGVTLYGGFPSTGTPVFADRNPDMYFTILSGDINISGTLDDNCYHVIMNEDTMMLDQTAVMNGFTIRDGNADGSIGNSNRGGGLYNDECNPSIYRCRFISNHAERGGGVYNIACSPYLANSRFIQNEAFETGGAILNSLGSNPVIHACTFTSNSAVTYGGAIANIDTCHATVSYCRFENNSSDEYGGAMINSGLSNASVYNCCFEGNSCGNYGGAVLNSGSYPDFFNCIFEGNTASTAGGAMLNDAGSEPSVINCTFYGNNASMGGGIANNNSDATITNCIIWSCGTSILNIGSSPVVAYSCIQGGYSGTGNISSDPLLEGSSNGDFRLTISSPAVNAGINDSVPAWLTGDYDNFDRIVGANVDMGAYESRGVIYVNSSAAGNNNGASWYHAFTSLDAAISVAGSGHQIWVAQGTYVPSNAHGLGATYHYYHFPMKSGVKMYGGFAGWENFESERDPDTYLTILKGEIGSGQRCYHVLLADIGCDTSTCLDGFNVRNGGSFGTGDYRYGGAVHVKNASVSIRNCDIEYNAAAEGGALAFFNSYSIVSHCTFYMNYASYTGGVVMVSGGGNTFEFCEFNHGESDNSGGVLYVLANATPTFYACRFFDSYATDGYGGAVYSVSGHPLFVSCEFSGNHTTLGGGAIFTESDLDLINVTIIENEHDLMADGTGLFIFGSPQILIQNSIIFDNMPSGYMQIESGSSMPDVSYCDIEGCGGSGSGWASAFGTDLGGNIDEDPVITLWSSVPGPGTASPCVDAGSDEPYISGLAQGLLLDCSGHPRFRGTEVDMGSLELPFCKLRVDINPTGAVNAGARWSIDNGITWLESGDSLWLSNGTLDLTFNTVAGYTSPADTSFAYEYWEDIYVSGLYVIIDAFEDQKASFAKIYPNPTTEALSIDLADPEMASEWVLLNQSAQIMGRQSFTGSAFIPMNEYPAGVYFIHIGDAVYKVVKVD